MRGKIQTVGVKYDEVLKRFMGKEDFYLRMLRKFLDDKNYEGLKTAVEEKRWADAFTYAHTVKVAKVRLLSFRQSHCLNGPEEKIGSYMEQVTRMYEETRDVIQSL